ncbi:Hypothetical protein CINCED_3A007538 [Cinara cedri]|uniref:Uncharacterized protein n=1 Tax=Cinara cedri TaxID=506608 RepID=A0A5E4M505_9HEMI|nr:Hypothetical protein CINCED_3A007538 [Cinara cedri]
MGSCKSCVTDTEREIKTEKSRPSVKVLIDNHRSFQDKRLNTHVAKFNVKNKSLVIAYENLNTSYNDCCRNMEGDTQRIDKIKNFINLGKIDHVLDNQLSVLQSELTEVKKVKRTLNTRTRH